MKPASSVSARMGGVSSGPRILYLLGSLSTVASAAIVGLLALPVAYDAVARALRSPTIWIFDTTIYLLIAAAFIGNAYALRTGAHFRMMLLYQLFPSWRRFGDRLAYTATALFAGIVTALSAQHVYAHFMNGMGSGTILNMPLWIPQLAIPLGAAGLTLEALRILVTGDYPETEETG